MSHPVKKRGLGLRLPGTQIKHRHFKTRETETFFLGSELPTKMMNKGGTLFFQHDGEKVPERQEIKPVCALCTAFSFYCFYQELTRALLPQECSLQTSNQMSNPYKKKKKTKLLLLSHLKQSSSLAHLSF